MEDVKEIPEEVYVSILKEVKTSNKRNLPSGQEVEKLVKKFGFNFLSLSDCKRIADKMAEGS